MRERRPPCECEIIEELKSHTAFMNAHRAGLKRDLALALRPYREAWPALEQYNHISRRFRDSVRPAPENSAGNKP